MFATEYSYFILLLKPHIIETSGHGPTHSTESAVLLSPV